MVRTLQQRSIFKWRYVHCFCRTLNGLEQGIKVTSRGSGKPESSLDLLRVTGAFLRGLEQNLRRLQGMPAVLPTSADHSLDPRGHDSSHRHTCLLKLEITLMK